MCVMKAQPTSGKPGSISNRNHGREANTLLGALLTGIYGFFYFALLQRKVPGLVFIAIAVSLIPHDMMYGWS
jgi:predicted ATP-grasp superfamily ATP-dependent carboligase